MGALFVHRKDHLQHLGIDGAVGLGERTADLEHHLQRRMQRIDVALYDGDDRIREALAGALERLECNVLLGRDLDGVRLDHRSRHLETEERIAASLLHDDIKHLVGYCQGAQLAAYELQPQPGLSQTRVLAYRIDNDVRERLRHATVIPAQCGP